MPNTKQALKRMRVTARRTARNRHVKSSVKTAVRRFGDTLDQGDLNTASDKLQAAVKNIDKAVSKGVVHKNAAARKKSRLAKRLNKAQAQVAAE
ncbi:30S ribosomal protein S20 [Dethiobacter alkaliphilus]|uniref:Small ribosomal subunit protein bS20 n=1 Tax=Dethiobacter alkaliphilus AHT 1 TaxID=555088 RepID=C0GEM9_DETAL|nr:30S ribosomal protein S20 [Dethiobacter alkaliphilus]EEG78061.1 ribosomal protein S20 [Dethiobacter alkaliphilus AHT 1]MCW3489310.1 30S ribosomal protein S20 [Dethiobacter alkaliphilus]